MRQLRISPVGVGDLLASSNFAVPTFQRSFAWKSDNVRNLLTDLASAIKRKNDGRGETYFLGSIVVVEREKHLEVVDGQQRLATASIILAAIRDYHWEIHQDRAAASYDQQYLRALHVPTGKKVPKLRLNEIDDRCFSQTILEQPSKRKSAKWTISSHLRLIEAYEIAMEHIRSIAKIHDRKTAITILYDLAEFMRTNAQVIRVMVDDEADAFTVFETLNDRHLPLTVADLLKNFLFGAVGVENLEEAKGNWREMIGALNHIKGKKDRIVDFIRQLWGSRTGLIREKELFRDIKATILDETEARGLSAALAEQASNYAAVLNPSDDTWSRFGNIGFEAISTFNALRVERIRPLLLAILDRFEDKDISKSLEYLRGVAVRLVVCGGINGTVEEKIFETAVQVHNGSIGRMKKLALVMQAFVPNDAVFHAHFATMSVTLASRARFYLRELEEVAKGADDPDRQPHRDERRLTLEHIIPTAAAERTANWPQLSEDEGGVLANRFGNLTLLGIGPNSRLNGKSFEQKLIEYAKCDGIYITKQIARDYTTWGEEQVNHRQSRLADLAVLRWPVG